MRQVSVEELPRLYAGFRRPEIKPDEVATLASFDRDIAVELLGVATLSGNGYTREFAVRFLGGLLHPRAVPFVLLRLGDWVEQVRQVASTSLQELMKIGIANELLEYHRLIERLLGVQRIDLRPVVEELQTYLRSEDNRPTVLAALNQERVPLRLFVYRLLEDELTDALASRVVADSAPSVRVWFARRLTRTSREGCADLVTILLHDKSSRVSTAMISSLSEQEIRDFHDTFLDLAFSDAQSVREAVRYALRGSSLDFAAESRRRILEVPGEVAPGVVASLGETGNQSDYSLVEPFLTSKRSRIREAAVEAAARLGQDQAIERILPLLDDASGRVRRAVVRMLAGANVHPVLTSVRSILQCGTVGGQKQGLRLLALQGGWESLLDLLGALQSSFESVREQAWREFVAWYSRYGSRGWLKPSKTVRCQLAQELRRLQAASVEPPEWAASRWQELRRWVTEEVQRDGA